MDGSQLRAHTASPATARPTGVPADGARSAAVRPAGPRSATTRPAGKRRRRSPGWVPNQHGAWAMVIVPALAGVLLSGPSWRHVPLLGLWWVGYFAFFATGLWLRSRRKARYWPPVRAYGLAMVPFAGALVLTSPHLVVWAVPFAPLVATTVWCSMNRRDRTLLNDLVTVVAGGLMTAVAYDAGVQGAGGVWGTGLLAGSGWWGTSTAEATASASVDGALVGWAWVWLVTALITAYFVGTILYVKTNIRERDSTGYLVASVAYHAAWSVFGVALAAAGPLRWSHAALWLVLLARAWVVPLVNRRHRVTPMQLGIGEIVASVLVMLTLLV